jgi:hypothetical protein
MIELDSDEIATNRPTARLQRVTTKVHGIKSEVNCYQLFVAQACSWNMVYPIANFPNEQQLGTGTQTIAMSSSRSIPARQKEAEAFEKQVAQWRQTGL